MLNTKENASQHHTENQEKIDAQPNLENVSHSCNLGDVEASSKGPLLHINYTICVLYANSVHKLSHNSSYSLVIIFIMLISDTVCKSCTRPFSFI